MFVHIVNTRQMFDATTRCGLLKTLEDNPSRSQRELAKRLGISLGKVNFCIKALVEKGSIKVNNFRSSDNKLAYAYFLTPQGVEEKAHITVQFLKFKIQEYEQLHVEIKALKCEAKKNGLLQEEGG